MSYIKADEVLPQNIIRLIQQYIDGENIYIPKKKAPAPNGEQKPAREASCISGMRSFTAIIKTVKR